MGDEYPGPAPADDSGADAPGAGTLAHPLAAGPRLDRIGYGGGSGPGSSYDRPVGRRLWRGWACGPDFRAVRWFPPALQAAQQAVLALSLSALPAAAGSGIANWNWRVVHQFVSDRFGISLSLSSCLNYLYRLGFAFKRPKKQLVKADEEKRESFVAEYAALKSRAHKAGEKIFFADEAHFRADAELRGKWVLRGEPSPRFHEGRLWLCRATARTSTPMRQSGAG